MTISKTFWRVINIIFYEAVFFLLIFYATILKNAKSSAFPWIVGDWLINYQGGFVRRGLIGEVLLRITSITGIEISILAIAFQLLLYAIFLTNTLSLSINSYFTPYSFIIIFSPAFILFPILDPFGGFRKEILFLAFFAILCNHLAKSGDKISKGLFGNNFRFSEGNNRTMSKYLPAFIGLISAVIVLSHEMLVVYLPYVICVIFIAEKEFNHKVRNTVLSLIPSVLIVIIIIFWGKGDKQIAIDICNSLKSSAPLDCLFTSEIPGAITFLAKDITSARAYVITSTPPNTQFVYALTAILSFNPLALLLRSEQFRNRVNDRKLQFWLAFWVGSAILVSLPLLWVVADYGRIIYIHITCISLIALMITRDNNNAPLNFRLNLKHFGIWFLCFLFIISWRLVHWEATFQNTFLLLSRIFTL